MNTNTRMQSNLDRVLFELEALTEYSDGVTMPKHRLGTDSRANLIAEAEFWFKVVQFCEAHEQINPRVET